MMSPDQDGSTRFWDILASFLHSGRKWRHASHHRLHQRHWSKQSKWLNGGEDILSTGFRMEQAVNATLTMSINARTYIIDRNQSDYHRKNKQNPELITRTLPPNLQHFYELKEKRNCFIKEERLETVKKTFSLLSLQQLLQTVNSPQTFLQFCFFVNNELTTKTVLLLL